MRYRFPAKHRLVIEARLEQLARELERDQVPDFMADAVPDGAEIVLTLVTLVKMPVVTV